MKYFSKIRYDSFTPLELTDLLEENPSFEDVFGGEIGT